MPNYNELLDQSVESNDVARLKNTAQALLEEVRRLEIDLSQIEELNRDHLNYISDCLLKINYYERILPTIINESADLVARRRIETHDDSIN